jgi:phosphatidylglycerol:prolipoprotein diacylglycerol transferase
MLGETTPLHPVALYAAFVALLLTAVLFSTLARPHAAGAPTALALALAGLAQFFLTFVRQPFPYENAGPLQLDPLQWVALGMIAAAAILTVSRRALLGRRSTELRSPHAV